MKSSSKPWLIVLLIACAATATAKKGEHDWKVGRVLDESRARYFAGMLNNSSSSANENGSWSGNADSTTIGNTTNAQMSGTYSGTTTTSHSGTSIPIYRVYDNLVIDGGDTIYVTSEHLRWRWSKSAQVTVNGEIKYYVEGRKLHVLDEGNKEHTIEIIKEIRKTTDGLRVANQGAEGGGPETRTDRAQLASVPLTIESTPPGADIEIDGGFVGNTPSTVTVTPGPHEVSVKKKGFTDWSRKLNVTGGSIHLSAELAVAAAAQGPTPP